jgi:hypothetical protein
MPRTERITCRRFFLGCLVAWSSSVALAAAAESHSATLSQGAAHMQHGNNQAVSAKAPKPIPDIESGRIKTGCPSGTRR